MLSLTHLPVLSQLYIFHVDQYKAKHPDRARHVDQQVRAGKSVREKNGVADISTENMTMEEYQAYFYALLDTIPYDSTKVNNTASFQPVHKISRQNL